MENDSIIQNNILYQIQDSKDEYNQREKETESQ